MSAVEGSFARLPILPEEWRRRAPDLCDGMDADFVLVDLGPATDRPRYTIIGLTNGAHSLHLFDSVSDAHAPRDKGGLNITSSLFVPLHRGKHRHRGNIAALYCAERRFDQEDVNRLQEVAARFVALLTGG